MSNNTYFIFVNLGNPVVKHNLENSSQIFSAGFTSASMDIDFRQRYLDGDIDYLPFVINQKSSPSFVSFYCASAIANYRVEYDAEITRLYYFKKSPSRLSAVYAFATKEDCIKASQLYQWNLNTVRKFTLLPNKLNKIKKVNMEIISLMRCLHSRPGMFSEQDVKDIWTHYWSGEGNMELDVNTFNMQPSSNTHERIQTEVIWEPTFRRFQRIFKQF
jgi:hypothetical protein